MKARGTRAGCVAAGLLETLPLPLRFVQRRWFGFSLLRPVPRFPRTTLWEKLASAGREFPKGEGYARGWMRRIG